MKYTINDIRSHLKEGKITSFELVKKSIETFEQDKKSALALNAFLYGVKDAPKKVAKRQNKYRDVEVKAQKFTPALAKRALGYGTDGKGDDVRKQHERKDKVGAVGFVGCPSVGFAVSAPDCPPCFAASLLVRCKRCGGGKR